MTLTDWLKREKITRTAFAAKLGVWPSFVTMICQGKAHPSLSTALKIEEETGGEVPTTVWRDAPGRGKAA